MEAEPSRTAMMTAVWRGSLRLDCEPPWVLDDPFGLLLVRPAWGETRAQLWTMFGAAINRESCAYHCLRSRYTEDRLAQGSFEQYVILGAGLDSFVWRHPDLLRFLKVFEVDHPATQAWKLERVADLALPQNDAHVYVPIDFETESLRHGLNGAGFDLTKRTMFSWLGVTPYLTSDAIEATLRIIVSAGSGSEVVFDYAVDHSLLDDNGRKFHEIFLPLAADSGEPVQETWTVTGIEGLIARCGLHIADHPTREETIQQYFAGRHNGLVPWTVSGVVAAQVV